MIFIFLDGCFTLSAPKFEVWSSKQVSFGIYSVLTILQKYLLKVSTMNLSFWKSVSFSSRLIISLCWKFVSGTFLLVCVVFLKESTLETRKKVLFHFKNSFRCWDNQILTFQIFKYHDAIKSLSMKLETHFIE